LRVKTDGRVQVSAPFRHGLSTSFSSANINYYSQSYNSPDRKNPGRQHMKQFINTKLDRYEVWVVFQLLRKVNS